MRSKRRGGALLLLLGAALMACGAAVLLATPDWMQYVLPAPAVSQESGELTALYEGGMERLTEMGDVLTESAIAARAQGVGLAAAQGNASETVTLYAVGAGYFEARYERLLEGRLVSEGDVKRAERVIVLDRPTALKLFPGEDAVGKAVRLSGENFEVGGVIEGGQRIGEADARIAYIPITAADEAALPVATVTLQGRAVSETGTATLMRDTLSSWMPNGSFYSLSKLKLGAVMPLRWLALIAGALALLALLRRLNARVWGRIGGFAQALKTRYARDLLPAMIARGLLALLAYAALLLAAFLLARFAIAPLLVFTEWVPEVVVELSSLTGRFWALNAQNAVAVRCVSREVCCVELGRGLLRWGLLAALLGMAVRGIPWLNRRVPLPRIDRTR